MSSEYFRIAVPQTNIAPEIQVLEDEISVWGPAYFGCDKCLFQEVV